jgi:hypothetical protein
VKSKSEELAKKLHHNILRATGLVITTEMQDWDKILKGAWQDHC